MLQFLEDPKNFNNSPYWLRAFASRIRESIAESDILSFLATELDGEENFVRVWIRLERHLSSTDIQNARVMTNWSSLLSTQYEDRDSFLFFYSNTKGILHKITKGNSIPDKDDVFLKAYFSMAIEAKELQMEVRR